MKESDFNSREEYVQARLAFLREKLKDLGELAHYTSPDCDPESQLAFLEHIFVLESQPSLTHAHQLISNGVSLPSPEELDDKQLHEKLWEVIHKLAELRVFLSNTNHLDDRALYTLLWTDLLNEFTWDMSHAENGALHLDILGSGSEEDTRVWLQYYATEEDRAHWASDFPGDEMPPRKIASESRDEDLPQPTYTFPDEEEEDFDLDDLLFDEGDDEDDSGEYPF